MGFHRTGKRRLGPKLTAETPLIREAAACSLDSTRPRTHLYRLLQTETLYLRTTGPITGKSGWQTLSQEADVGFLCMQAPDGQEYLPVFDHPSRLVQAARQAGVEGDVPYIGLEGDQLWQLAHPQSVRGAVLNPGRSGSFLVGRFEMDVLSTGIYPGELEEAITAGDPLEELLQYHPVLVPCDPSGQPAVTSAEDGSGSIIVAFSSTAAFTAYLARAQPSHVVCMSGAHCLQEAGLQKCRLQLNPDGPVPCTLSPLVAVTDNQKQN